MQHPNASQRLVSPLTPHRSKTCILYPALVKNPSPPSIVAPQDRELYLLKALELRLTEATEATLIVKVGSVVNF